MNLPYALVDSDNHYYEPRDAFTRHMPAALRDRVMSMMVGLPRRPRG